MRVQFKIKTLLTNIINYSNDAESARKDAYSEAASKIKTVLT